MKPSALSKVLFSLSLISFPCQTSGLEPIHLPPRVIILFHAVRGGITIGLLSSENQGSKGNSL